MPLGAGPAHVVQFGPVGIEEALGHALEEVGKVGGQTLRLAVGQPANCLSHDPLRSASCCRIWLPMVRSARGRTERPVAATIIGRNLLKTSTNSPAISRLSASVAKKIRLGLLIDALMSQYWLIDRKRRCQRRTAR